MNRLGTRFLASWCIIGIGAAFSSPAFAQSSSSLSPTVRKSDATNVILNKIAAQATETARIKLRRISTIKDRLYAYNWLFYSDCDAGNKQAALADVAQSSTLIPKLEFPLDRA